MNIVKYKKKPRKYNIHYTETSYSMNTYEYSLYVLRSKVKHKHTNTDALKFKIKVFLKE